MQLRDLFIITTTIKITSSVNLQIFTNKPKFCSRTLCLAARWETELLLFSPLNDNVCFYGCVYMEYCPIQLVSTVEGQCGVNQCIYQPSQLTFQVCWNTWFFTSLTAKNKIKKLNEQTVNIKATTMVISGL